MQKILAITTFNRIEYLETLFQSWRNTVSDIQNWKIVIADDGSTDGTIEYIENLQKPYIYLIKNKRKGIHHQTNTIIKYLSEIDFDIAFFCNDDISFLKKGWDELYINAIKQSEYQHLCFYDQNWDKSKTLKKPIIKDKLIAYSSPLNIQGPFFTITPKIIEKVGYLDCENFGFRGRGHVDYSIRCARAGFNNPKSIFDVKNSNDYIKCNLDNYKGALNENLVNAIDNETDINKKEQIINQENRIYLGYNEAKDSFDFNLERKLWQKALTQKEEIINSLKKESLWYKTEFEKTQNYYLDKYERLPKIIKLFCGLFTTNKIN